MKKLLLISILVLYSCGSNISKNKPIENITFSENMSFEEFKVKLEAYSKIKGYPNIND